MRYATDNCTSFWEELVGGTSYGQHDLGQVQTKNKAGFAEGSMTVSLEGRTAVGEACGEVEGSGGGWGTKAEASREGTQDGRDARLLKGNGWRIAERG